MKKPLARRTKRTANKKPATRTLLAKRKFIASFTRQHGNVTKACKAAHVSRSAYYEWAEADPVFKQAVDIAFEAVVDHVEDKLHQLIDAGEPSAVYFFLKCRAKDRGYVERQEIAGKLAVTGKLSISALKKSMKGVEDADAGE